MFTANHVIGIQGGKGSFNEAAIQQYLTKKKISQVSLCHLYTTENVLHALNTGEIAKGQFAISNSLGGVVEESLYAMARYRFEVLEMYKLKISHSLMIHKNADLKKIKTIMTHPQVLKQCQRNLAANYSHLTLEVGKGELIDPAKAACYLSKGALPLTIAILSNRAIAKIYNLKVIEDNLQDDEKNETTFMLVGPYSKMNRISAVTPRRALNKLVA